MGVASPHPWVRLYIDHARPFMGKIFLVVVDAYSKWLEVEMFPSTSSQHTLTKLRSMFATHGLLQLIVSDNGTAFTSSEFQNFLKRNGIRHVRSAPYHPASNRLAKWYIHTFKTSLKKSGGDDLQQQQLSQFLLQYRTTPHSTTWSTTCSTASGLLFTDSFGFATSQCSGTSI